MRGRTPLERAIYRDDLRTVLALIQSGTDVNARLASGRTALMWAAQWGRLEIVRALVRASADLNVKDEYGWTPLTLAAEFNHFDIVQALVEAGASIGADQLRKLVNAKDARGDTPLARAEGRGDIPSVRALVQLGADPNARSNSGWTLLTKAADAGRVEEVRALIEAGADVNAGDEQGWNPLVRASFMGHADVVRALLRTGANANVEGPRGWSALMWPSYYGRLETVRALIPAVNVNYRSKEGVTALMLARWACHADVVEALIQAGAVVGPEEWRRAPEFADFPVRPIYKGVAAPVDLNSSPRAREFRTRLRQGAQKGPNFAGHYTVVSWGCGSNCESNMIVDAITGKVYDGVGDERGAEFRLDSNLFIADRPYTAAAYAYEGNTTDKLPIRYFVWEDQRFKLIYEEACRVVNKHQECGCQGLPKPMPEALPR